MIYHSQYGQDKFIHETFFTNVTHGIFVEIGALDGILDSNTLFFERRLHWSGILIEPNPTAFALLESNRPHCHLENIAISDESAVRAFTQIEGGLYGWSGLEDEMEPQHWTRIRETIEPQHIRSIPVRTHDVRWLADKYDLHHIDFMSIDTEGAEEKIIRSFPWDRLQVSVFCIENNFGNYDIDGPMENHGYQKAARIGTDDIYASREIL